MQQDGNAQQESEPSGAPVDVVGRGAPVVPEEGHLLLAVFRTIACPEARARVVDLAVAEARSGARLPATMGAALTTSPVP